MASLNDILSSVQNGVVAFNNLTKQMLGSFLNISGQLTTLNFLSGCGYFNFSSATLVIFNPFQGGLIKVNGTVFQIPSGGISAANTGIFVDGTGGQNLAASTLYYVYIFNNSGNLTIDFSTTAYATSSTAGNVGTTIKSGDNTRSLIGLVFTNGANQFVAENVISWFNKKSRQVAATATATTGTVAQVEFSTWSDQAISFGLNSKAQNGTLQGAMLIQLVLDGATIGIAMRNDVPGAASTSSVTISGTKSLSVGRHTIAQAVTTTGTPSAAAQETYVLFVG